MGRCCSTRQLRTPGMDLTQGMLACQGWQIAGRAPCAQHQCTPRLTINLPEAALATEEMFGLLSPWLVPLHFGLVLVLMLTPSPYPCTSIHNRQAATARPERLLLFIKRRDISPVL